jgi:hypothetical protein
MATVSKGYTFGSTELVTNTKLHSLVDSATVTSIVNADVASNAAIVDTKLAQISTYEKVLGASFGTLSGIASAAGFIPLYNLASGTTGSGYFLRGDRSWAASTDEKSKVSSNDTTAGYLNGKLVAGSGITFTENSDGSDETLSIASKINNTTFTATGSFTASAGMTKVFLSMVGGGGGGGGSESSNGAEGGGGGGYVLNYPYTVASGSVYNVTIGGAGGGGAQGYAGSAGGDTAFGTGTVITVKGGKGGAIPGEPQAGYGGGKPDFHGTGVFYIKGVDGSIGSGASAGGGGGSPFGLGGADALVTSTAGFSASGYGAGGGGGNTAAGGKGSAGFILVQW